MIAPEGQCPPQVLEIGKKLRWKYYETRYIVFFAWSQVFNTKKCDFNDNTHLHDEGCGGGCCDCGWRGCGVPSWLQRRLTE